MANPRCLCERLAGPGLHPRCIGQVWLFDGLDGEAREAVARNLVRRRLVPGEVLFRQGEPADTMYLLKAGSVKLWKITEDGRSLTLDLRRPGDLLGESVFLEDGDYPVSATCLEPVLACGVDKGRFERLVEENPGIGMRVIRNLAQRIEQLRGKLEALSEPMLEERMYRVLVNVAQELGDRGPGGWTIPFPLTHEEIACLVGAHRVSVTRALGRLRSSGRIRSDGRNLFVAEGAP